MKVLLINPPFNIGKANYDDSVSVGLLSIATYLNSKGISVRIIDGVRQKDFLNLVKKEIIGCFCAGISVMTTQIPNALEVSRLIKEVHPQCQIVWGGTHPTFFPRETAIHPLIDIVCFGEGEETLFEIVSSKDHSQIKGIAYKRDDHIIKNPPRKLGDPAKMPLFNWDLVPEEVLHHLRLIPSLTSRGCPHRCAFCINAILKNKWRPRTAQQVLQDLKIIKENKYFWGKKIRFWDENFFVDIGRAKQIINDMITNNLIIPWETTVRVDYIRDGMIDEFFMENLKKSGCYLLSFGAESGSPRILEKIQKGITPEQILYSAEICLKHDIIPQYSFMIGLPGETKADMMLTVSLIDKLARLSDKVQILGPQPFRPYPGSILYEECFQTGWGAPHSLEEWAILVKNELNYLTVQNFPWVKEKDFVDSMEAYVRFGAHSFRSALGSSVKAQLLLRIGFILFCQLRWKLKFFYWPFDFKLAKKYVTPG